MNLNDEIERAGIAPEPVCCALRHRPSRRGLNSVLPWLVAERLDLFNAYQQTQAERGMVLCIARHPSPISAAT